MRLIRALWALPGFICATAVSISEPSEDPEKSALTLCAVSESGMSWALQEVVDGVVVVFVVASSALTDQPVGKSATVSNKLDKSFGAVDVEPGNED